MENRSIIQELTSYRVKIEKDGKAVADIPGILCLPGLITMPRLSLAGIFAAPVLGYRVRLEKEDGQTVDVENAVRKAAETVVETAADTARTIREEIDKTWQSLSADDPEPEEDDDVPTIQVDPDDSAKE